MGEERITRDVEGHPEKDVRTTLVQLAAETTTTTGLCGWRHVELEEGVAGHQGHLGQLGHVPGAHDDAAAVGVLLELLHHFGDLVDVATVRCRPTAPLHAVDRTKVAIRTSPLVPNGDATFLQPARIAVAAQKPQQFQHDGFPPDPFGGDQWKAGAQVKAHLVAENALGASTGAVTFGHTVLVDMAHEVFVGGRNWVHSSPH